MTRRRSILLGTVLAGLMLALPGPAGLAGPATAGTQEITKTAYASAAFKSTNNKRENRDRARLRHNDCMQKYAVKQARRMANREELFHQDLGVILNNCGLNLVGENVAFGYPTGKSVVVDGWMKSVGHRANILNRSFKLMGLAARKSDAGTWYAAQVFGRKA